MDVSKAIDKVNGEAGRLHKFTAFMRTTGLSAKQINEATGTCMGSHYLTDKSQPAIPTCALWEKLRPLCGEVPSWVDELVRRIEAEREVVGRSISGCGNTDRSLHKAEGFAASREPEYNITAPATDAARQWSGWGTALKPAFEPALLFRKPLTGTVAENVMAHGTGALNISACRVPTDVPRPALEANRRLKNNTYSAGLGGSVAIGETSLGRFPANIIHDGSPEVLALFPDSDGAGPSLPRVKVTGYGGGIGSGESAYMGGERIPFSAGSGSAARFFYCPKASRKDRSEGLDDTGPKFTRGTTLRNVENAIKSHGVEYLLKDDAPDWVRAEVERLLNQSS